MKTPQDANLTEISWTQATAGANAIASNKVYRSSTSATTGFTAIYTSR